MARLRAHRPALTHRRRWAGSAAIAVLLAVAVVIGPQLVRSQALGGSGSPPVTSTSPAPIDAAEARRLLAEVPVQGRAPLTGYRRDLYGNGWPTVAGCDVRNRILGRDLVDVRLSSGHSQLCCGVWHPARLLHRQNDSVREGEQDVQLCPGGPSISVGSFMAAGRSAVDSSQERAVLR